MRRRLPASERRQTQLLAAIDEFARSGYHGTTTAALARAAGVSEAMLYRHFTNKKALFLATVQFVCAQLARAVDSIFAIDAPPGRAVETLFEFFHQLLSFAPNNARLIYVVVSELDDPEIGAIYLEYQHAILDKLEQAFRRWQSEGQLSEQGDPRAAAWVLLGMYQTLGLMHQSGATDAIRPADVRKLVLGYFGADPDPARRDAPEGTEAA